MTITTNSKGNPTAFSGEKAVDIFRLRTVHAALGLAKAGIRTSRKGPSFTQLLQLAGEYTGVKYKRGEYDKARDDLKKIEALRVKHVEIVKQGE